MNTLWVKGLKGEAKEKRKEEIKSYRTAFEELAKLLEEESMTKIDYDCPSWSHKQADQNGYNRAIRSIKKLIDIKDN